MTDDRRPSYDELAAENAVLRGLVEALQAEVAELKRQLGRNSSNSSQPPSTDSPFTKPAPMSLRAKTGRRPGGQAGHTGRTLRQVADPDRVVVHEPGHCGGCGAGLAGATRVGLERRQVFDIPPIAVQVTEHQLVTRRCAACGCSATGTPPAAAAGPACYGPNAAAVAVYLYAGQFLSRQRTAQALAELFGTPVSAGTVSAAAGTAAEAVTNSGVLEATGAAVAAAPVAHFDETGMRVAGRLHGVHSASTSSHSLITVDPKRGRAAMDAAGVLPAFTGVAVHDAWAPYDGYTGAGHALRNAHLLRELTAVTQTARPGVWCWAGQARDALLELKTMAETAQAAGHRLDPARRAAALHRLTSAAVIGAAEPGTGPAAATHRALARRLRDRRGDYLRFLDDPGVPFDNNAAERDIRMIKLRQKVSGCLRSLAGAETFCALRSYLATAGKHGVRFIDALTAVTAGQPWTPTTG